MNTPIVNEKLRTASELRAFVVSNTRPVTRGQYKGRLAFKRVQAVNETVDVKPDGTLLFYCGDLHAATLDPNDTLTVHLSGDDMRYANKLFYFLWHALQIIVHRISVHSAAQYGIKLCGDYYTGVASKYIRLVPGVQFNANRECINPSPFLGLRADKPKRAAALHAFKEFAPHYHLTHSRIDHKEWDTYFTERSIWGAPYLLQSEGASMLIEGRWEELSVVLRGFSSSPWRDRELLHADHALMELIRATKRLKEPYVTSTYVAVKGV
jgi:hypothetical protein